MLFFRSCIGRSFLGLLAALFVTGCTTPKHAYHTRYEVTDCKTPVTKDAVIRGLVKAGFLRGSETKGPLTLLQRPKIVKKGFMSSEPYENQAGEIGVAVCEASEQNPSYMLAEEWRSCENRKDCTSEDQAEIKKLAESWGCKVVEKRGRSVAWGLEDHQDWNKQTCPKIATMLEF